LVTRNFPPLLGGMERVNQQLLDAVAAEWRPALCGPAGAAAHVSTGTAVAQTRLNPLPLFLVGTSVRAVAMAWRLRPAVVVAGSGLSAPMAWLAARLVGAKCAVYLHGLDVIAPSRVYQWLWLPFIRACDLAVVNSRHTGQLCEQRGVKPERIRVLNPGTDLPPPKPGDTTAFRSAFGLGERPILLSVGRFTRRKGLAEFAAQALPQIVARYPDVLLLVIGGEASAALHGSVGGETQRIQAAASAAGVAQNLKMIGHCDDTTLNTAYQAASVHVFPVLDLPGDVEGFGMVALESAARGLPTVAFSVGGVPDAVEDGVSGRLVSPGDYAAFAQAVVQLLSDPADPARAQACREFAAGKQWTVFAERFRELLRSIDG
jgi:phosphatidylinositol alpha-1,6-mannosyltransferase